MILGTVNDLVVNDVRQFSIGYREWLNPGETLTGVTFTVDSGTAVVTNIILDHDHDRVLFNVGQATFASQFNVLATATTNAPWNQTRVDVVHFICGSNGGPVITGNSAVML